MVIAHRLSTIQNANQIIVLESGKILDSAAHITIFSKTVLYTVLCGRHISALNIGLFHRKEAANYVSFYQKIITLGRRFIAKRLYLGCLCSFLSVWCTAIPIVIAAWTLGLVIADFRGENSLEWNIIWLSLVGIVISIFLRYIFSYWKAKLQESIGYEIAAEERLKIGNVLKRVSLGYFSKNSTGDILTAITGDLSSLELQGMKLIDAIVNGYINLLAIVIILLIVCPMAALTSLVGAILSALALNGISKKKPQKCTCKTNITRTDYGRFT